MLARALRLEEEERHIVEILPLILKKDARFRQEVLGILSETLATKDEIKQILEEMRISREESNRRFEAMEQRFEAADRRFEAMDQRFEALVQEMRDGFALQAKALKELETSNANALKKLETSQTRATGELSKATEELSTALKEFKTTQTRTTKELETSQATVKDELSRAIRDLGIKIDTVGARWGIFAESTIRNTLKDLLLKNLKVAEVKEWKVQDRDGVVFGYPQEIQVDLLIKNGEDYIAEIKSSAGSSDVTILTRKAKLYEQITGTVPGMIFVAVDMKEEGKRSCEMLNVRLISYEEIKD